jgi:Predicted phosphohydrolases
MTQTISFDTARPPEGMRLVAIGDVHGHTDLLSRLLDAIDREIAADRPSDWRIATLGDYIDRGPDSRGVIDLLIGRRSDPHFLTLAGNHDDAILAFLADDPGQRLFLDHGGRTTAASYGVTLDTARLGITRDELAAAMPAAHLEFLRGLGSSASFGDYFLCHAGIRPGVALELQTRADLTWIRREFLDHRGLHPKLIVHGHTPQTEPEIFPNRVNVDTRAYETGVLTALVAEGERKWFLHADKDGVSRREVG